MTATVHICIDPEKARSEIPNAVAGNLEDLPETRLGTNCIRPVTERKAPRAILCGAGISPEEFDRLKAAVKEDVVWIKATRGGLGVSPTAVGPPDPSVIANWMRRRLQEMGL
ncbi:hypothetical protein EJ06DRAFT_585430 [Trichodelitschia bisporula]|uniref:Uncharacterized protein n=1 Tax=Trichodelitschia bisporula TaxID=703511 RepID=A0A6G1HJJ3_9PEZI|nr:hypothetical protein EJ06DRAFT_585430 [Trichodelitschia bisporula]